MRIELANCTATLLAEIEDKRFTKKSVAKTYALALRSSETTDWVRVNRAIIARWSFRALEDVKRMAHSGKAFSPTLPASGEEGR